MVLGMYTVVYIYFLIHIGPSWAPLTIICIYCFLKEFWRVFLIFKLNIYIDVDYFLALSTVYRSYLVPSITIIKNAGP